MEKKDFLMTLKIDRDHSKRQVLQEIAILKKRLSELESKVENGEAVADDGLQGNEWRLYKELSNLEKLNSFLESMKQVNSN